MNYRIIGRITGSILLVEAACLVLPLIVAACYGEALKPFILTIVIMCVLGLPLSRIKNSTPHFFTRDGFAAVALAWIVLSLFGALPFYFCGYFDSLADCIFEAASGFTTTGASILVDIESLPRGILFWRSFTNFLGGMGILVLMTAILPESQTRMHHLMRAEVPGPTADKLVPRLSESSKILYTIYVALTVIMLILLITAGLPFYDAATVALSTAGTGGFCVMNDSIAGYNNSNVEMITAVFMLIFSVNFAIYFLILTGKWQHALKSSELRFFLAVVGISILFILVDINSMHTSVLESFHLSFFTVSAIISTTGFGIVDYNLWPGFSKSIILMLMLMGACAGSTSGGIKASRVLMVLKSIMRETKQILHPRSVNIVRMDGRAVAEDTLASVFRFLGAYFVLAFLVTAIVSLDKFDFTTNFTAAISCLSNVGPGLGLVGPMGNFSIFSDTTKLILSLCMIAGRLEIFPILVFLSPAAWKRS